MSTTSAYKRTQARRSYREAMAHYNEGSRSDIVSCSSQLLAMPAAAVPHPLGPPTVSGTNITVDTMLTQATRVTRMIMDLTLQRFVADRVFANAGGVMGGAVVFDQATLNELYATRDVERVEPGAEVPIITSDRTQPQVAPVEKWGGKVWVSDEARERNNVAAFTNQVRQLSNTLVRRINARAIEVLEASITASGQTTVGRNWSTASDVGPDASTTTRQNLPMRDFALAQKLADVQELGVNIDLWLLNPQEYMNLVVLYGAAGLGRVLQDIGISVYASNRVTAGTAYALASGQVGEMRIEKPLSTESWREPNRERTWVQSTVRPVMYVTNPYAVIKFTGLAG